METTLTTGQLTAIAVIGTGFLCFFAWLGWKAYRKWQGSRPDWWKR